MHWFALVCMKLVTLYGMLIAACINIHFQHKDNWFKKNVKSFYKKNWNTIYANFLIKNSLESNY